MLRCTERKRDRLSMLPNMRKTVSVYTDGVERGLFLQLHQSWWIDTFRWSEEASVEWNTTWNSKAPFYVYTVAYVLSVALYIIVMMYDVYMISIVDTNNKSVSSLFCYTVISYIKPATLAEYDIFLHKLNIALTFNILLTFNTVWHQVNVKNKYS